MKKVTVLHDFDGKPYFKALEKVAEVTYLNTRPIRFMLRDLIKHRKIQSETLQSLFFLFKLPFIRRETILLGMAPFNARLLIYSWLCKHNRVYLHTSWHQWQGEVPFEYPGLVRRWLKRAWRRLLPNFAGAVAVTSETKRSLSQFLPELEERIVTIPHVVDIDPIDDDTFEHKWADVPDSLLFTGRLTAAKGVRTYLDVAHYTQEHFPQVSFHMAGRGEMENEINDYLRSHQNLRCHGFISDREQLQALMAQSHFLLLPSRRVNGWEELFGLVVIEAMSQGCVVIATDHIGPREIIAHTENGLLCTEDDFVEIVKRVLGNLHSDRILYAEMARKALADSRNYSMKIVANKWLDLINKF